MAPMLTGHFLDTFNDDFEEKFEAMFLEMGSCGLHVVHGAF